MNTELDYNLITDIHFEGIDHNDYPKYCDAYIYSAKYKGEKMSKKQLESLNYEFIYKKLMEYIQG